MDVLLRRRLKAMAGFVYRKPPISVGAPMPLAGQSLLFLLGFVLSALSLGTALYLEHGVGLAPCALCLVQRFCMAGFAVTCLSATVHRPGRIGRRLYGAVGLLFSGFGALAAGRQVWLQNLPSEQMTGCVMPLERMLGEMPLGQVIHAVFDGSADCLQVSWSLYGMSVAEWSLLAFAGFILLCIFLLLRRA